MCLCPKTPKIKEDINTTVSQTRAPRPLFERIVDPYSVEFINHLDIPVRVIITPGPVKSLKYLNIMKIGSIGFDKDGNYQKQELIILPESIKKVLLDNRKFYVSAFFLLKDKWKKLWLSRLFKANGSINFIDRHKKEAVFGQEYKTTEV